MSAAVRKIAVLMGGPSAEHEVSVKTGEAVINALKILGYETYPVMVKGTEFQLPPGTELAFICLHGTFGEDGQVQYVLREMGIPFTGSGVSTSQVAFAKDAAKRVFYQAGIPTPLSQMLQKNEWPTLEYPYVLKPNCQGSSLGLQFVFSREYLDVAMEQVRKWGDEILVEQFIPGRELTVGILGRRTLPIVEIRPKEGFYDYTNKYTPGATDYYCPADLSAEETINLQELALHAHDVLGCQVYSRVDIIYSKGKPWVLEVNTIPGMTQTSLLPKAAAAANISFIDLVERIVFLSLEAYAATGGA
jgi:D-alanine-D-alanine ligase